MKVAVIGLDSAPPDLVFDKWRTDLPNLNRLMEEGAYGPLRSVDPPITVPAWSAMMTGKEPGALGFYGFRNRKDYSYDAYSIANSNDVTYDRLWDVLSRSGKRVIIMGVPQTYPVKPVKGFVISDFLTPSTKSQYTHPPELRDEVERVADGYVLDVEGFRTSDKEPLLERVYEKTRKHFRVAKHLVTKKPWDFFMLVEMGTDRIQHGFWSYMDTSHPKYHAGNPFENAIFDYYKYLDGEVGELINLMPKDTVVLVVSDHGAKGMDGGICINEWLMDQGLLKLKSTPKEPTPLKLDMVDWDHTVAWGEGGYHGRLFMNVKGREPNGLVESSDYERTRQDIIDRVKDITDPNGRNIGSLAYQPDEIYTDPQGVPPDLTIYFGALKWRSVGSVGIGSIHTFENDTGPDEANHDWYGIFLADRNATKALGLTPGAQQGLKITDVGPKLAALWGLPLNEPAAK